MSLGIKVSWDVLLAGDAAAAAAELGAGIRDALRLMQADAEEFAQRMCAAAGRPGLLLSWNSWARVGRSLRSAGFGPGPAAPARMEWLNSRCCCRSRCRRRRNTSRSLK